MNKLAFFANTLPVDLLACPSGSGVSLDSAINLFWIQLQKISGKCAPSLQDTGFKPLSRTPRTHPGGPAPGLGLPVGPSWDCMSVRPWDSPSLLHTEPTLPVILSGFSTMWMSGEARRATRHLMGVHTTLLILGARLLQRLFVPEQLALAPCQVMQAFGQAVTSSHQTQGHALGAT